MHRESLVGCPSMAWCLGVACFWFLSRRPCNKDFGIYGTVGRGRRASKRWNTVGVFPACVLSDRTAIGKSVEHGKAIHADACKPVYVSNVLPS